MSYSGSDITTDLTFVAKAEEQEVSGDLPPGISPYRLALRRLRRNKVALFFGGVFIVIVILCLLAPVYSQDVAHIGPNYGNITGQIRVGGKLEYVAEPPGHPDRTDLEHPPLLPRRRFERARRRRAPALRRPQLALHRRRRRC